MYLMPALIAPRLEVLCRDVVHELGRAETEGLLERVKVVASFLSIFLNIHPFSNGNGRVARILTSLLLSRDSIVPVSLRGSNKSDRETYLECLRGAQRGSLQPDALARLILDNVRDAHRNVCLALDLNWTASRSY